MSYTLFDALTAYLEDVGKEIVHADRLTEAQQKLVNAVRRRLKRAIDPDGNPPLYWEDDVMPGIHVTESGRLLSVIFYDMDGELRVEITDLVTGEILEYPDGIEWPTRGVVTTTEALAFLDGMVKALWAQEGEDDRPA